jgi:TerC family integral membrane protein
VSTITLFWLSFVAVYLVVFCIDFYVTSHRKEEISVGTALRWTALWVSVALMYGGAIYLFFPQNPGSDVNTATVMAIKYIAGYLTEYSLSVDNLFVFIMIFALMGVHKQNQPRLLKLGILLSIVLRILFILVGLGLVHRFGWILYVFGAILIWTAWKMAFTDEDEQVDPKSNILYRQASKMFPLDPDPHTPRFFTKIGGKVHITSVLLVFLVIGSTDVLFAIDSIPAIIGVIKEGSSNVLTQGEENFIAITSNVFAVMGLVSLFFGIKGIMGMFRFLKHGVSFILFFIGVKMMLGFLPPVEHFFKAYSWVSLAVILATLVLSIVVSAIMKEEAEESEEATAAK